MVSVVIAGAWVYVSSAPCANGLVHPHNVLPGPYACVPTKKLDQWLTADFKLWLETPGPRKAQRSADNKRRLILMDDDRLKPYRQKWELLERDG
jgi:hypothetical protein